MAYKPKSQNTFKKTFIKQVPAPKVGNNRARVALVVELGLHKTKTQNKETGEWGLSEKEKPLMAVYADLVNHRVDYGTIGDQVVGEKPYRLALYKEFNGETDGTPFVGCFSYDKDGKKLENKGFTFHNQSLWAKLARATGQTQIIDGNDDANNMDIEQLLGQPFNIQLDINTYDREYEKEDGSLGVQQMYTPKITNYSMVDEELLASVPELDAPARIVTFENATEQDVLEMRPIIRKKIAEAKNFAGTRIQSLFEKLGINEKGYIPRATESTAQPSTAEDDSNDFDDDIPF